MAKHSDNVETDEEEDAAGVVRNNTIATPMDLEVSTLTVRRSYLAQGNIDEEGNDNLAMEECSETPGAHASLQQSGMRSRPHQLLSPVATYEARPPESLVDTDEGMRISSNKKPEKIVTFSPYLTVVGEDVSVKDDDESQPTEEDDDSMSNQPTGPFEDLPVDSDSEESEELNSFIGDIHEMGTCVSLQEAERTEDAGEMPWVSPGLLSTNGTNGHTSLHQNPSDNTQPSPCANTQEDASSHSSHVQMDNSMSLFLWDVAEDSGDNTNQSGNNNATDCLDIMTDSTSSDSVNDITRYQHAVDEEYRIYKDQEDIEEGPEDLVIDKTFECGDSQSLESFYSEEDLDPQNNALVLPGWVGLMLLAVLSNAIARVQGIVHQSHSTGNVVTNGVSQEEDKGPTCQVMKSESGSSLLSPCNQEGSPVLAEATQNAAASSANESASGTVEAKRRKTRRFFAVAVGGVGLTAVVAALGASLGAKSAKILTPAVLLNGTTCGEDMEVKKGNMELIFKNLDIDQIQDRTEALEKIMMETYNELAGCESKYSRTAETASLSNISTVNVATDPFEDHSKLEWAVTLSCLGCPDQEPLFSHQPDNAAWINAAWIPAGEVGNAQVAPKESNRNSRRFLEILGDPVTDHDFFALLCIHFTDRLAAMMGSLGGHANNSEGDQHNEQQYPVTIFRAMILSPQNLSVVDVYAPTQHVDHLGEQVIQLESVMLAPTEVPSAIHTSSPTPLTSFDPTLAPSEAEPIRGNSSLFVTTSLPTRRPTRDPGPSPGPKPVLTSGPTPGPSPGPTSGSTPGPTAGPTPGQSHGPTPGPNPSLTSGSTPGQSVGPTQGPTPSPSPGPTPGPTTGPGATSPGEPAIGQASTNASPMTKSPAASRPAIPTKFPSEVRTTDSPTTVPTKAPSRTQTKLPTTRSPTTSPTETASGTLSKRPSQALSWSPTTIPTTETPTESPTRMPTKAPTSAVSKVPTTGRPSKSPLDSPSIRPTNVPTITFTVPPTKILATEVPTQSPTRAPAVGPSKVPTKPLTSSPTSLDVSESPTKPSTEEPPNAPTKSPTEDPTTKNPTDSPTITPSKVPSNVPTKAPSKTPSNVPSKTRSLAPSSTPTTRNPTDSPIMTQSAAPSDVPTKVISKAPSNVPSKAPSLAPSAAPTRSETMAPTRLPSTVPTIAPTKEPTEAPNVEPSRAPTQAPSSEPSMVPTNFCGMSWVDAATTCGATCPGGLDGECPSGTSCYGDVTCSEPTNVPVTRNPTSAPTETASEAPSKFPTTIPTTGSPTDSPTSVSSKAPTAAPSKVSTTGRPSKSSSDSPSNKPTHAPTIAPTSEQPTESPTKAPIIVPSMIPTEPPTGFPTNIPTTESPTKAPTKAPTNVPTESPTEDPTTRNPTNSPTLTPSNAPTKSPTRVPTPAPTPDPTPQPTPFPTLQPTPDPTPQPTNKPTIAPSPAPTIAPTLAPTPFSVVRFVFFEVSTNEDVAGLDDIRGDIDMSKALLASPDPSFQFSLRAETDDPNVDYVIFTVDYQFSFSWVFLFGTEIDGPGPMFSLGDEGSYNPNDFEVGETFRITATPVRDSITGIPLTVIFYVVD